MSDRRILGLLAAAAGVLAGMIDGLDASVSVNQLFSDHMVLQRDLPIPIWGSARPGEVVTVTLGSRSARATADAQGRWLATLDPLPAGGPMTLTIAAESTITIRDVLIGEVWLCSGQSNMQMDVKLCLNAQQEIAAANYPLIRQFEVPRRRADEPQSTLTSGQWDICSPATVGEFSGVAYFFARKLHHQLGVPIGLINAAWGGTPVEAWIPREELEGDPDCQPIYDRWQKQIDEYLAKPESERRKPPSTQPVSHPDDPRLNQNRPSVLFNRMIHPAIPYAIRGVIWYQGESNVQRAYQYRKLFPRLINSWRSRWGQGNFPFLFVQLSNYQAGQKAPYDSPLAELREAQAMALSLPRTGMAVAIDIGDGRDCHPLNKQEIAGRLVLAARKYAYKEDLAFRGPEFGWMSIEPGRALLVFANADGGLVARGEGPLQGFAVAGEDRRFFEARAVIEDNVVIVSSENVPRPVAVRYAWSDAPECNLYNGLGLPAVPFRTDDWPGVTRQAR